VDRRVGEPGGAQAVDRRRVDGGRLVGERDGEVAERAQPPVEASVTVVVGGVSR
jgi:hypothetical protein